MPHHPANNHLAHLSLLLLLLLLLARLPPLLLALLLLLLPLRRHALRGAGGPLPLPASLQRRHRLPAEHNQQEERAQVSPCCTPVSRLQ